MAVLAIMTYGNYTNKDAVRNVLAYALRVREDERRVGELVFWAACSEQVLGYRGARYKGYENKEEAFNAAMIDIEDGNDYIIHLDGKREYFKTYDEYIDGLYEQ